MRADPGCDSRGLCDELVDDADVRGGHCANDGSADRGRDDPNDGVLGGRTARQSRACICGLYDNCGRWTKTVCVLALRVNWCVVKASYEAMGRQKYLFSGVYLLIFGTITCSLVSVTAFGFGLILHPVPVWDPRYVIPISGMLLGNAVSAVGLALNTFVTNMMERREELDLMLSFGANKYEASLPFIRNAVTTGLTPTLNSMAVIGLVSLPGMMTGQILGGAPPVQATRYQVMIMYFIASCSFLCVLLTVFLTTRIAFDSAHIFRKDRFKKRQGAKKDVIVRVINWVVSLVVCIYNSFCVRKGGYTEIRQSEKEDSQASPETSEAAKQRFSVIKVNHESSTDEILSVRGVKRSVPIQESGERITLFEDVGTTLYRGDLALLKGQSGR